MQLLLAHTDQPAQLTAALSAICGTYEPAQHIFGGYSNVGPMKLSEGQQRCCRLLFAKGGDPTDLPTELRRAVISALRECVQQVRGSVSCGAAEAVPCKCLSSGVLLVLEGRLELFEEALEAVGGCCRLSFSRGGDPTELPPDLSREVISALRGRMQQVRTGQS